MADMQYCDCGIWVIVLLKDDPPSQSQVFCIFPSTLNSFPISSAEKQQSMMLPPACFQGSVRWWFHKNLWTEKFAWFSSCYSSINTKFLLSILDDQLKSTLGLYDAVLTLRSIWCPGSLVFSPKSWTVSHQMQLMSLYES